MKEYFIKKNGRYLLSIASIILLILTGCQSKPIQYEYLTDPGFPTVFFGTWVREGSTDLKRASTRTFTTNTYKISTQSGHWVLESVSGDTYTLAQYDLLSHKATETIRYVDGKLIIETCGGDGENQCGGVWVRM